MSVKGLPCPGCGTRVVIPEGAPEKSRRCPKCGKTLTKGAAAAPTQAVSALWKVGDVVLGLYEVSKIHESGGMGLVYRVRHRRWKTDLAVKSPRPEFFETDDQRENFIREAETWVHLGLHPHVVSCYYIRTLGGVPRVFAEYVDGGSLAEWIRSRKLYEGGLEASLERMLDIAIQFAWGLEFAHEHSLVHQDVKPANVMMTADGTAKVSDFGLARARGVSGEARTLVLGRSALMSVGGMTEAYCSPEQRSKKKVGRATDVWSWGVSVLEMFTGRVTWISGVVAGETLEQLAEQPAKDPAIPRMPDRLIDVLRRCFRMEPSERWDGMGALASELEAVYAGAMKRPYPRPRPKAAEIRSAALNNRAVSMYDLGRGDEAEDLLAEGLKEDPHHVEATYNRDLLRWRRGEISDEARVRNLTALQQSHAGNATLAYLLGIVELGRGNPEAAAPLLTEAGGDDPDALTRLGEARMALERWSEAAQAFEAATKREPEGVDARAGLALAWSRLGRKQAAEGAWDALTPRLPAPGWPWSTLEETRRRAAFPCIRKKASQPLPAGTVRSAALSPDGGLVAVAFDDGVIRLLDLQEGHWPQEFEGHAGGTSCVLFSRDGRQVISGGRDGLIAIWDLVAGTRQRSLRGHSGDVLTIAWTSDSTELLSAGSDGTVRVWDSSTGAARATHTLAPQAVCAALKPSRGLVAVAGPGAAASVLHLAKPEEKRSLQAPLGALAIAFSPDGRRLALSGEEEFVAVLDTAKGSIAKMFRVPSGARNALAWDAVGGWLLTGGKDGTMGVWDAEQGRLLRTLKTGSGACSTAIATGNGAVVATASELSLWELKIRRREEEPRIAVIQDSKRLHESAERARGLRDRARGLLKDGKHREAAGVVGEARAVPGYERSAEALDLLEQAGRRGRRTEFLSGWHRGSETTEKCVAATVTRDGIAILSEVDDGTLRTSGGIPIPEKASTVRAATLTRDGGRAFLGLTDTRMSLIDLRSGKTLAAEPPRHGRTTATALDRSGLHAASGGEDGRVSVWSMEPFQHRLDFRAHGGAVTSLAFSADGRWLATAGGDRSIGIWDSLRGKKAFSLKGDNAAVLSVAWAPTGTRMAAGDADGDIQIWDAAQGDRLPKLQGHTGAVRSVCWSEDGRWLLSGGADGTVRLWDAESGKGLWTGEAHGAEIREVALGPTARRALSRDASGACHLWEFDWRYTFDAPAAADGVTARIQDLVQRTEGTWKEEDLPSLHEALCDGGLGAAAVDTVRKELAQAADLWKAGTRPRAPIELRMARRRRTLLAAVVGAAVLLIASLALFSKTGTSRSEARSPSATVLPSTETKPAPLAKSAPVPPKPEEPVKAAIPPEIPKETAAIEPAPVKDDTVLDLGSGITLELVRINPGVFIMGGTAAPTIGWQGNERPKHPVTIRKGFQLGKYEVTRGQFAAFVKATNYKTDAENSGTSWGLTADKQWVQIQGNTWRTPATFVQTDEHPVTCLTWNDAKAFCDWATTKTGREVRLPTEAEWEYTCRAGSETTWSFGERLEVVSDFSWVEWNSGSQTHPVGQKKPNAWGLYDMHGNVWEWCQDWGAAYPSEAWDPTGPASGFNRILRGGSWYLDATYSRSAFRHLRLPNGTTSDSGFRVAVSGSTAEAPSLSSLPAVSPLPPSTEPPPPPLPVPTYTGISGHRWTVSSIAFDASGKRLASASWDGAAKLWDAITGRELVTLKGHTNAVQGVAFQPNGKLLATSCEDRAVRLWDAETGTLVRTLTGHGDRVDSIAFRADGKVLASASWDKSIRLWDPETGTLLQTLTGHAKEIQSIAFRPDGKVLASGSYDYTIKLWDLETGKELRTLHGHLSELLVVAFSPDGTQLASGSVDKTLRLWNPETGKVSLTLLGHSERVTSLAFSPDGKQLASGSQDRSIKLWDTQTGKEQRTIQGQVAPVNCLAFRPDGKVLLSGGQDSLIRVWKESDGIGAAAPETAAASAPSASAALRTLSGHFGAVHSIAYRPDGKMLASGSNDKTIRLWDPEKLKEPLTLLGHQDSVQSVVFHPNGRLLASGSKDKTIRLWDAGTGTLLQTLSGHSLGILSVAFQPDGKVLAAGSEDNTISVWDVSTGKRMLTLPRHSGPVSSVAFRPDGKVLASGSMDSTVKLWDLEARRDLRTLSGHFQGVYSVAFRPDGKVLASASFDQTIKVWDVETGRELRTLSGHSRGVGSVAFGSDGKVLVSASFDHSIKVWDVETGTQLRTLTGHLLGVDSVALRPDGKVLASGSDDMTIKLWDLKGGTPSSPVSPTPTPPVPGPAPVQPATPAAAAFATKSTVKRSYGPEQATGEPDTLNTRSRTTAWASKTPDGQQEWLILDFEEAVDPARIKVYESYSPGALVKISVFNSAGRETTVWTGKDPLLGTKTGGIFDMPIRSSEKISRVKLYIDSPAVPGYNEIDAVGLVDKAGKTQWAVSAEASSTRASSVASGRNYGPEQATGPPDTDTAGDHGTAWASKTTDGQQEWLVLNFAPAITPVRIKVYESYNPGALIKVAIVQPDGTEVEAWSGKDPTLGEKGIGIFDVPIRTTDKVSRVKLYIDSPAVPGYNEIDAVGLVDKSGTVHWAVSALASSSYADR